MMAVLFFCLVLLTQAPQVLIFDKPKDGWKSGNATQEKQQAAQPAGGPDLSDLLGALRTQMASVEKGKRHSGVHVAADEGGAKQTT
jgi:hypothetical protein